MGIEGAYPTAQEIQLIRQELAKKLSEIDPGEVDQSDVARVNSDDKYVSKFFRHVFDNPGEQTEAAVKMILNTLRWRREMGASHIRESDFSQPVFDKGALFSRNRDKDGKKLLVFSVFKHIKGQIKMEDMKKFFVYYLERLYREEEGDQITLLFDCREAGLKNMDMEFVQFIIGTLKEYYPDPLNYIIVLEMPWVLNAAFKVIKGWLPPPAVKKIKFVTKANMNEFVSEENMLEEWGGTDTWQYTWVPETSAHTEDNTKDEGGKKKVTFANMVQSPSQESVGSMGSLNQSSINNNNNADTLLITPANEVIFTASASGDLVAKLQIQNISSKPVGYKIKTTSPEKYRVRPSTGSLAPNQLASVEIHFAGGQSATTPAGVVKDKFLITSVYLESAEISQQQLTEALKNNKPDSQYRLRCQMSGTVSGVSSSYPVTDMSSSLPASPFPPTELDANRQMANILKKVNQISVKQEELASQMKLCVQILLILIGLVTLLLVVSLFYSNISNERLVDTITRNEAYSSNDTGESATHIEAEL